MPRLGGSSARLTAKERILLHLLDYTKDREAVEVPPAMTQEGVASAAGVELRHLSQYLRPLLDEELVRERTSHVKGIRQRRKVYTLTDAGQHAAYRLRDRVKAERVRVQDAAGAREAPMAEVLAAVGGRATLLDLVRRSMGSGTIDLDALTTAPSAAFVERLAEAPHIEGFVGREAELTLLTKEDGGPRVFVVHGVAGIGKSSVAAKACERLRGTRNLYWHTLRPWDTRTSVLADLGEFLHALGRPALRSVVSRGETSEAPEVLREDLPGTHAFLVFDDAHEASPEVLAFFGFLKDATALVPDVRVVFLTRRALGFYDRRDVALRKLVLEVELAGLTSEDILVFLAPQWDAAVGNLGLRVGGHPLFLQLVRSLGRGQVHADAMRDMNRFLEEEIYRDLSEAERKALRMASLYQVPVPREALLADPVVSYEVLLSLVNRVLLRRVGEDAFEAHDAIRHFFASLLTSAERESMGNLAGLQLRTLASRAREGGNPAGAVGYLSNALSLVSAEEARSELWEALGDANEELGDLPASLTAFKEAIKLRSDSEGLARLHRKTAAAMQNRGNPGAAAKEAAHGLRVLGDTPSAERGWLALVESHIAVEMERWTDARERANEALQAFQAFDEPKGRTRALVQVGSIEIDGPAGDLAVSERNLREGLALATSLGDLDLAAKARTMLAYLFAYRLGNAEAALEQIHALETLPRTIRDPHARRALLMLKGWIFLETLGDCPGAAASFNDALALARKIHDGRSMNSARYGLAYCEYFSGRVAEAREAFERSRADFRVEGSMPFTVEALWMVAECSLRLGDLARFDQMAAELDDPALRSAAEARPLHAWTLRGLHRFVHGDREGWHEAFQEAFRHADRAETYTEPAVTCFLHFFYGLTLRSAGQEREANEHLRWVTEALEANHLRARQAILPVAERELAEVLSRAADAR